MQVLSYTDTWMPEQLPGSLPGSRILDVDQLLDFELSSGESDGGDELFQLDFSEPVPANSFKYEYSVAVEEPFPLQPLDFNFNNIQPLPFQPFEKVSGFSNAPFAPFAAAMAPLPMPVVPLPMPSNNPVMNVQPAKPKKRKRGRPRKVPGATPTIKKKPRKKKPKLTKEQKLALRHSRLLARRARKNDREKSRRFVVNDLYAELAKECKLPANSTSDKVSVLSAALAAIHGLRDVLKLDRKGGLRAAMDAESSE